MELTFPPVENFGFLAELETRGKDLSPKIRITLPIGSGLSDFEVAFPLLDLVDEFLECLDATEDSKDCLESLKKTLQQAVKMIEREQANANCG